MSAIVWVRTPSIARKLWPISGANEIRLRCGLRPTSPQHAAGIRVEPPPSLAWAIGTIPAATAAAEPPDEPPVVRSGSHGLRVGPKRFVFVQGRIPHSGSVVLPTTTKPAARSRRTTLWSYGAGQSPIMSAPYVSRRPAIARLFFTAIGTPANGRSSPGWMAAAAASASSWKTSTNAFSSGLRSSMRRNEASTRSRADSSPARTAAARSSAGRRRRSSAEGSAMSGAGYPRPARPRGGRVP